MDILNFISWIKAGNYRLTLPTDVPSVLPIGAKDPGRDDEWLPMTINTNPLLSLYNTGVVTQTGTINSDVTLNAHSGVITTVSSTLAAQAKTGFRFYNSNIKTNSIILLSVQYGLLNTGIIAVSSYALNAGDCRIAIANTDATASLNDVIKIHFTIINPQ